MNVNDIFLGLGHFKVKDGSRTRFGLISGWAINNLKTSFLLCLIL